MKCSFSGWGVSIAVVKVGRDHPSRLVLSHQVKKLLKQIWPRPRQNSWTHWTRGPEKGQGIEPEARRIRRREKLTLWLNLFTILKSILKARLGLYCWMMSAGFPVIPQGSTRITASRLSGYLRA